MRLFRSFCLPLRRTGSCGSCDPRRKENAGYCELYTGSRTDVNHVLPGGAALAGSFTVEAALLMAVLIPLLVTCLFMSEYLCDRTRAEAVLAEETALLAAGENASVSGPSGFFFINMEERQVSNTESNVQAALHSEEKIGIVSVQTAAEAGLTKRKPVKLLRKLERIKALFRE